LGKLVVQAEELQIRPTTDPGVAGRQGEEATAVTSVAVKHGASPSGELGEWESVFFVCFLTRAEERVGVHSVSWG
jgi:hypothetical protein